MENNAENNVNMLINILSEQERPNEADQITLLINQIRSMEKSFLYVFRELQDIKSQMDEMRNEFQSVDEVKTQFTGYEEKTKEQYGILQSIKDSLNKKAGEIIQNFKDFGVKALNNVCTFLGIKEKLIQLRDMSQSNAVEMKQAAEKVNDVGQEVKNTMLHMKNIGRTLKGEEKISPESEEQPKIFQKLKGHYEKRMEKFERRTEKLNESIAKFTSLEQATEKISVKAKLADNKAAIAAKEATEPKNPMRQQEAAYAR
ncbi:MAG: hypothetical protein NC429_16845 [Lachnospiraceae bacterium]|nr:hypothetical protein [Lachnospiraceae bacterium]